MKERKAYGTGKVVGLSVLCFLLIFLLSTLLLVCVTVHRHAVQEELPAAMSAIPLQEAYVRHNGEDMSFATYLLRHYVENDSITESQMNAILRDSDFNEWLGEKTGQYTKYFVAADDTVPFPMIGKEEINQLFMRNESTFRLHTGMDDVAAEANRICSDLTPSLNKFNQNTYHLLAEGSAGFAIRAIVSKWIWCVLGGLLTLLLIWLIVIHVRGRRHVGTALKTFSVAACIPCAVLLLWGAFGVWILGAVHAGYLQAPARVLHNTWLLCGGFGLLGCAVLFSTGIIWNRIAGRVPKSVEDKVPEAPAVPFMPEASEKAQPTALPTEAPAETPIEAAVEAPEQIPEVEKITRHYCRFCGEPLVNSDAKFCYKCGTTQEQIEPDKTE